MPAERLLASYIIRVLVRSGMRSITLHDVGTGETHSFSSYQALLEHLGRSEEAVARQASSDPQVKKPP